MNATLAQRRYQLGARMFTRTARSFLWWLIGGSLVTFTISIVFSDALEIGAWTITASVFQWFVGVSAGIAIHQVLPAQIATGLTRREITAAFGVFGALLCAAAVLFVAAGLLVEHALLSAVADPSFTLGETAAQAARYLVVTPLYCSVGLALGAAEVRMRPNALQVPALLSAAAVLAAACMWVEYSSAWSAAWTAAGIALIAAMAAAFVLLMRGAPVHPKRA
ncbi:hypothetical protein [Glycomyces tenuis]|uniref:hypothetical protein n=1 Tax=Glycomyces tenuis TaxID=58116 RepID=UPI0004228534|nr:hypothetical protein [Glycomyces tenuis]